VRWQDGVGQADAVWTRREFERAISVFTGVFGEAPRAHAAAGWQINPCTLALEAEFGLRYASDTRGTRPFYPVMAAVRGACLQVPTTLPTLDELIGVEDRTPEAAADEVLRITRVAPCAAHVFTLHAELEGQRLLPQFERLLRGWLADGCQLVPMCELVAGLEPKTQPRHEIEYEPVPGRSGVLAVQGRRLEPPVEAP
jgi:peptidoglycan/xylan/chitin deacetylase (PgdA/CDA1 family)